MPDNFPTSLGLVDTSEEHMKQGWPPRVRKPVYDYLVLEDRLIEARKVHPDGGEDEDKIIEEMDTVWWTLTNEEQDKFDSMPSRCWPEGT